MRYNPYYNTDITIQITYIHILISICQFMFIKFVLYNNAVYLCIYIYSMHIYIYYIPFNNTLYFYVNKYVTYRLQQPSPLLQIIQM